MSISHSAATAAAESRTLNPAWLWLATQGISTVRGHLDVCLPIELRSMRHNAATAQERRIASDAFRATQLGASRAVLLGSARSLRALQGNVAALFYNLSPGPDASYITGW